jgi:uncharacterized protein (TIGR02270 family)
VLNDVVELHLDEAAWLWAQWRRALFAPDFDLADAAEWEERLLAHVDGLVEGGQAVSDVLLGPALESSEPERISAAFLALLHTGPSEDHVRSLLRGAEPLQRASMQRALEVYEGEGVAKALQPLLRSDDVALLALALETLVFREEGLEDAQLADFLRHEDARVRISALRGLREPGQPGLAPLVRHGFASAHAGIRAAAIEAGFTGGLREAGAACRRALQAEGARSREALVLWALGGGEDEARLLIGLLEHPQLRADALWALGFSGRVCAADACMEWLGDAKLGRLAGEAFCAVTGLRLEGPFVLPGAPPPEEPIPLESEDLDADLVPGPEDDLPVPDAAAVASWWGAARAGFVEGTRYLMGHPFKGDTLLEALARGPMRRRHVWARELAIRSHGACRVRTQAFSRRQRAALERARPVVERLPGAAFVRMPAAS